MNDSAAFAIRGVPSSQDATVQVDRAGRVPHRGLSGSHRQELTQIGVLAGSALRAALSFIFSLFDVSAWAGLGRFGFDCLAVGSN
jgi:hypothetical protein